MNAWLVLVTVFAVFLPALVLPGPDCVAVVRTSLTRGRAAGLLTALGVSIGLAAYATLSLVGLAAILAHYQWLAWAVRVLGGCYLAWLGLRLLLTRPQSVLLPATDAVDDAARPAGALLFGLAVTLTNPKAIVLFTSVFATAVTDAAPAWLLATMVALVFTSALTWYAAVSQVIGAKAVRLRLASAGHWIERTAGLCFIAVGGHILADARHPLAP
jgi:threonine/homoserine/homoserine lactone efflux protein